MIVEHSFRQRWCGSCDCTTLQSTIWDYNGTPLWKCLNCDVCYPRRTRKAEEDPGKTLEAARRESLRLMKRMERCRMKALRIAKQLPHSLRCRSRLPLPFAGKAGAEFDDSCNCSRGRLIEELGMWMK